MWVESCPPKFLNLELSAELSHVGLSIRSATPDTIATGCGIGSIAGWNRERLPAIAWPLPAKRGASVLAQADCPLR